MPLRLAARTSSCTVAESPSISAETRRTQSGRTTAGDRAVLSAGIGRKTMLKLG